MHLVELCSDCDFDTYQDRFETQDGKILCGPCYLTDYAGNEGMKPATIANTAFLLYADDFAWELCRKAGISDEIIQAMLES